MEKVTVSIGEKEFTFWESATIDLSFDTLARVQLTAPFEGDRKEFREVFRPFSFKPLRLKVGGELIFTGTLVGVHPRIEADSRSVEVTAYALPGVLQDCGPPGDTVPHEYKGLGLKAIAEALCRPFGINVKLDGSEGAVFKKVRLEEGQTILEFLIDLARQRGFSISNTASGVLLFWKAAEPGDPVAVLVEGEAPVATVEPEFSPQEYYSEITGFCATKSGRKGSKWTEPNPWLRNVLRPMSFRVEDTDTAATPEATRAKLGRMFANVATFTIDYIPSWRDPNGKLWAPNTTLKLTAPGAMIYRRSEFLIRNVSLKQEANEETARLEFVLPGAFSGKPPPFLPWDEAS